jgi:hypothetical protein
VSVWLVLGIDLPLLIWLFWVAFKSEDITTLDFIPVSDAGVRTPLFNTIIVPINDEIISNPIIAMAFEIPYLLVITPLFLNLGVS